MATSAEILSLLCLLREIGMDINFLWGFLHDESKTGLIPRVLDAEEVKSAEELRAITFVVAKAKQEPVRELTDEVIQRLVAILPDQALDEHFTINELHAVSGIVARWKTLRPLQFVLLPGERVARYLRQATTCYLYGLPDAAVILCRAVLQFALEEAIATLGGISVDRVDRKDSLEKIIHSARDAKILSPELAAKAHRIRKVGNESVHKSNSSEARALDTIKEAAEILEHLYGRTRKSAQ